jgi:SAM-dependent methyltransferase
VTLAELHLDRDRAESFGSLAEAYDRHRPGFPDALLDDLAALGADALDVGCGTGKVARGLAARGVKVVGVELDPRMAAVARGHGVYVEVAAIEEWEDGGRRFDVVTCGDAWHWIEPRRGEATIARVLRPGGAFVRFWNVQLLDEEVMRALDVVYQEHAPEAYAYGRVPTLSAVDSFPLEGPFAPKEAKTYAWERRVSGAEWAAFAGTISDHQRLPPERLARLLDAMRAAMAPFGESIRVRGVTTALFARREG